MSNKIQSSKIETGEHFVATHNLLCSRNSDGTSSLLGFRINGNVFQKFSKIRKISIEYDEMVEPIPLSNIVDVTI